MNNAVSASEWARREQLVFVEIERAAVEGRAAPSHDRMSQDTGLTVTQTVVSRLVAQGRIAIHSKYPDRKCNQLAYEIKDPASPACGKRTGMNGHQSLRTPVSAKTGTLRPCISCEKPMLSTGPHHRMCDGCRSGDCDVQDARIGRGAWNGVAMWGGAV